MGNKQILINGIPYEVLNEKEATSTDPEVSRAYLIRQYGVERWVFNTECVEVDSNDGQSDSQDSGQQGESD